MGVLAKHVPGSSRTRFFSRGGRRDGDGAEDERKYDNGDIV